MFIMHHNVIISIIGCTCTSILQSYIQTHLGNGCTKWKKIKYTSDSISLFCGGEHFHTFSNIKPQPGIYIKSIINYASFIVNALAPTGNNTDAFKGTYTLQKQCKAEKDKIKGKAESSYYNKLIGFGAAVALLLILLLVVTGGCVWTCWILRKTTEIR